MAWVRICFGLALPWDCGVLGLHDCLAWIWFEYGLDSPSTWGLSV
ncbi:MAG: hypothetical protein QXT63_00345 [Thermoplasmata archaeon]